ncbi:hypothetical protein [Chryseobacterium camelliae]|nr:hypothetical protein [Chryseobacterium camelliae]
MEEFVAAFLTMFQKTLCRRSGRNRVTLTLEQKLQLQTCPLLAFSSGG